jgi:hypothetical protein
VRRHVQRADELAQLRQYLEQRTVSSDVRLSLRPVGGATLAAVRCSDQSAPTVSTRLGLRTLSFVAMRCDAMRAAV